jgi:D-amino peptidase
MKIYIISDLEGVAGVQRWAQTREHGPLYEQACRLLTAEVNASVDGILDAAPDAEVVVWDGHGSGGIDVERFHPRARLIGRGPIAPPYCLDETYDAQFFVGQHAMAGTPDAPLSHTYSSRTIEYYKLNGVPMGEFGCRAALAGSLGIPTVFVSGDDKVIDEAKALIPELVGVAVKEGQGIELAIHLSPVRARELIREGAAKAIACIDQVPPFRLDPPYEHEIRLLKNVDVTRYRRALGVKQLDDRTFLLRSDSMMDLRI